MAPWSRVGKAYHDYSPRQLNRTKASALLVLGKSISDRSYSTRKSPEANTNRDHFRNGKTLNMGGAAGRDEARGARMRWALWSWYTVWVLF